MREGQALRQVVDPDGRPQLVIMSVVFGPTLPPAQRDLRNEASRMLARVRAGADVRLV